MAQCSITVWLDQTYDPATAEIDSTRHLSLCKVDPYLLTFRDSEKCIDYITQTQVAEKKLILLISSKMPFHALDTLLHLRQEFSQIDSVYVFNSNEMDTAKDVDASSEIYTNMELLCNHLRQVPTIQRHRREGSSRDDFTLSSLYRAALPSTLSSSTISQLLPTPSTDITTNRQEAEFMYAQFLRDILVGIESTEKEMMNFCREKCADNKTELNVIDEFEAYYDAINAIFWYTRDTFLYRLLNRALREQDVDTLYSLRYFIKDLHLQLKQQHVSQQQTSTAHGPPLTTSAVAEGTIETVYRGQLMDNEEFDKKIRHNTGGFFSVCSFFSTTSHKNLATMYAGNRSNNEISTEQSVLLQIDIDKTVNKFPYANISSQSAFDKVENEILFTMGAVFRINSVDLNDEGIWNVKLKLTGEEDKELRKLTDHITEDAMSTSPLGSLARLMMEMAKYDEAEKYHLLLLEDPTNIEDVKTLSAIYNNLGYIHNGMGRQIKAIEYYENALDIKLKHLSANDSSLASAYNNLAIIYNQQGEYEKALSFFHKAIVIDLNAVNPNPNKIANRYNNIGLVYCAQKRDSEALGMFEQCLKIQFEVLPSNHPGIATCHSNISQVYHSLGDYEKAIEYLNRTLHIQISSLPPNHPDIARTYNSLGHTYDKQGKLKEAVEMYDKSLEIDLKILSLNHPSIIIIYNNISLVYNSLRDYDKAIEYLNPMLQIDLDSLSSNYTELAGIYHNLANAYHQTGKLKEALEINEKSLKIRLKVLPANHPDLAASYNNISQVYDSLGNYGRAIEYLDQTLQVQMNSHPRNDPVLASTYNNLAGALYEQGEFDEALQLYKKSLEIRLQALPSNHPDIATSYNNISQVYDSLGIYEESIFYSNKLLEMQMKTFPSDHIIFAGTYNNLGLSYYNQGELEEALVMHGKCLEIRLIGLPTNHPDIATSYYNISLVHFKQGDNEKAIEYLNKTLKIELHSLSENHPDLAKTYDMLAGALYEQGKFKEALESLMKSYDINSKYLSPDDPKIIDNLGKISLLHIATNNGDAVTVYGENIQEQLLPLNK